MLATLMNVMARQGWNWEWEEGFGFLVLVLFGTFGMGAKAVVTGRTASMTYS
jgi:hypothetical protein